MEKPRKQSYSRKRSRNTPQKNYRNCQSSCSRILVLPLMSPDGALYAFVPGDGPQAARVRNSRRIFAVRPQTIGRVCGPRASSAGAPARRKSGPEYTSDARWRCLSRWQRRLCCLHGQPEYYQAGQHMICLCLCHHYRRPLSKSMRSSALVI